LAKRLNFTGLTSVPRSVAASVGTKWPIFALVNACSADPPSIRSAVVRPPRVTLICPVWQAAQLTSSISSLRPVSKVLPKPTGRPSGFAADAPSTRKPYRRMISGDEIFVFDHGISRLRNQL
jgi:hypothetical protein